MVRESPLGQFRWVTVAAVAAVVALNVIGIWSIAVSRQSAIDHLANVFRLETATQAHALESLLSSTRADLLFLVGSPTFFRLEGALASEDPGEAQWRRQSAEAALLLFLRGHAAVDHVVVRSGGSVPLVAAARRGGIPVLWRPSSPESFAERSTRNVTTVVRLSSVPGAGTDPVSLEARMDTAELLAGVAAAPGGERQCVLRDASGRTLALAGGEVPAATDDEAGSMTAGAAVHADGWSAPSPWALSCLRPRATAVALLGPLAARYRLIFALNLIVMVLALVLGSFVIQQVRRREHLEARAREEGRQREAERQLFHAERLSTVGRLAAGMAHEINNPLEGMANYLALASESIARGDTVAADRHLAGVRLGLERAAAIVRQILDHADPARTPREPVNLRDTVMQAARFVGSRKEFGGIDIRVDANDPAVMVTGNQVLLGQVFLNLILNACEAQPDGGEVLVDIRRMGHDAVVKIADRGPGIPPGETGMVFEPFYSTKRSAGLGLSICYSIMKQHEGEIDVENRPGGGAVFHLRFPDVMTDEPAREQAS